MLISRFVAWMFSVGLTVSGAGTASGQDYPNKPIRMVTQAAASTNDFVARLIADGLTTSLHQQVIVENRGFYPILALSVAQAPPDGYTLLASGTAAWNLSLLQKTPYDPLRDFLPITSTSLTFNVLVVHPSLPVNSVKELIALAKAKPGAFNYASSGTGGAGHLQGEMFKSMAGVNIVHVPYKGGGAAAIADLLAGQVHVTFENPSAIMPLVKAGKLKALAVTTAEPSELIPGLPTVAATLPGFESVQLTGIYAPAKTPAAIVRRLNQEIVRILQGGDVKEKYFSRAMEVVHSTPEEFAVRVKFEIAKWAKVIKEADIKAD